MVLTRINGKYNLEAKELSRKRLIEGLTQIVLMLKEENDSKQRIADHDEYCSAWHDYWSDIDEGIKSYDAIQRMIAVRGGVARKQAKPQVNGIYLEEIETLCELIQDSFEKEVKAKAQF